MLKSSKLAHKHKSKVSAVRKSHLSRKNMRSRSPVRHPGNSRPPPMKRMSPGMKRGHPVSKRKSSHSPRLRPFSSSPHRSLSHRSKPESPVPIERARPMKNLKYDKRRRLSNSPVRHLGPSGPRRPVSPHMARDLPPYLSEQYENPQQYSPPIRKKTRRSMSASPPRRHPAVPMHSDVHIPRRDISPIIHPKHQRNMPLGPGEREKISYDMRSKHESPHGMPRNHSKDVAVKMSYNQGSRYRSPSPADVYPPSGLKTYGPTLHERFSSVVESNRTEPRVRYSREDLEKITIDIRRNIRDPPSASRHGILPSPKLIHRANEGHRPIFDREEIKASRYLREEVYVDSKSSAYGTSPAIDLRNVENYQVTRHRYDSHPEVLPSTSGRSLNDRWPGHEMRKDIVNLDRDEREKDYVRVPVSRGHVRSRSRSGDRDFRSERYIDQKPSTSRSDYSSRPLPPPEPRSSAPYPPRKSDLPPPDSRHKMSFHKPARENRPPLIRSEIKGHYVPPDLHYPEDLPPPRADRRDHHSPIPEPHRWEYKSRSPSREKVSDYPRRPEKYDYKPWMEKPALLRSPPQFEHEPREGPSSFRGGSRPFRSPRGFRGRGFRGTRGGSYRGTSYRGGYRTSSSPRGRGMSRR